MLACCFITKSRLSVSRMSRHDRIELVPYFKTSGPKYKLIVKLQAMAKSEVKVVHEF